MPLSVYVLGCEVATLEPSGDFKSVLSYHPGVGTDDFVSLTMPVRTESYVWDDQLPPVLQMNLPEGYLLQVLQEQLGPHIGASPAALLSVIGRNMVGRLQVAAPGATLDEPAKPIEVSALLKGDNSEAAFAALVREHATSGVSGVVPKFLDSQSENALPLGAHPKASLVTRRHIVKGSSARLPFVALNEHLCMQVARRIMPTAQTQVSDDGQHWWCTVLTWTRTASRTAAWKTFAACWACALPPNTTPLGSASPKPCATMCLDPSG
jgi:serine/threonine-protein kinase HipA